VRAGQIVRIQSGYVDRSLMLVTALSPVIGYDKASKIAHYAIDNDLTRLRAQQWDRLRNLL
jgi:fumarate hydratase class II